MADLETINQLIRQECDLLGSILCEKNRSYGGAAFDPVRLFSQADALEQIKVRLDDKITRLVRGGQYPGDNDRLDLLGYLVLLRVAGRLQEQGGA